MKKEELKKSWQQMKTTLKEKYDALSEKDLNYVEGKEDVFYHNLQKKLGKSRTEVDQILEKAHSGLKEKFKQSGKPS